MKKIFLTALTLTSMAFADITWQTAQELLTPTTLPIDSQITVDAAGNALNVLSYMNDGIPLVSTSIHTAAGSSWGTLASLGTMGKIGVRIFPGVTGTFVIPLVDQSNGNLTSRTITTGGTLGTEKTITAAGSTVNAIATGTAANPSGNAIICYTSPSGATSSAFSIYTASTDTWATPVLTAQGTQITNQAVAADAGGNYGIALRLDSGVGRAAFKIGSSSISSYTQFDTGITDETLTFAAQVKATDSDGLFLLAYAKSNNVFAQLKAAGSSTTLTSLGQVSNSGDTIADVRSAMNKDGDAIVAWQTEDDKLIAAKYTASSNTFASPITIATNSGGVATVSSDSNGDFHIFYETSDGPVVTMVSASMSSTSSTWNSPVTVHANASGAEIGISKSYANPRGTKVAYVWVIDTSYEYFAAFGSASSSSSDHGAPSAGGIFRKGKSGLRPGRKPYR